MKAFVTSVGEPTTELCVWALQRNGFDVQLLLNDTSLAQKLAVIYSTAQEEFLRVDADIIVNRNLTPSFLKGLDEKDIWWYQFLAYDWYKQDTTHCMAYLKKEALPAIRQNIGRFINHIRPETEVSRVEELHNPRRMYTYEGKLMGIHGFGIREFGYVRQLKSNRGQSHLYDFELAEELYKL